MSPRTLLVVLIAVAAVSFKMAAGCSCQVAHPQQHACTSDFVIVAKVKRESVQPDGMSVVYKVKVKKEFKMSEKAAVALKSGRLVTSRFSSMCGVSLDLEKHYLVAGRLVAGQARISLCSFIRPWDDLTTRQKKGFRLLYQQGCLCKVIECPFWKDCPTSINSCPWQTSWDFDLDCQGRHSVCTRQQDGRCGWTTDRKYRACMKTRRRAREEQLANEP